MPERVLESPPVHDHLVKVIQLLPLGLLAQWTLVVGPDCALETSFVLWLLEPSLCLVQLFAVQLLQPDSNSRLDARGLVPPPLSCTSRLSSVAWR